MNSFSQRLLVIAQQIAQAYTTNPQAKAAMVTGSVAEGEADQHSDLDMSIYYDQLPNEAKLQAVRQQMQGSEPLWTIADRSNGAVLEAYKLEGVECQIGHFTIAALEQDLATVLEQLDVKSPLQKVLSGILICRPLYGESLIQQWQETVTHYPDRLAQAMVEQYLQFVPLWKIQERLATRDTTLWQHQILVEAAQNILGVLAGLNRLYYSTFQFKRMGKFIAQMTIAPDYLGDRLESLFHTELPVAATHLRALVRDTVELVELHMSQVNTSKVRQSLET
jgi:predicted nucleotidyltransferase